MTSFAVENLNTNLTCSFSIAVVYKYLLPTVYLPPNVLKIRLVCDQKLDKEMFLTADFCKLSICPP